MSNEIHSSDVNINNQIADKNYINVEVNDYHKYEVKF